MTLISVGSEAKAKCTCKKIEQMAAVPANAHSSPASTCLQDLVGKIKKLSITVMSTDETGTHRWVFAC